MNIKNWFCSPKSTLEQVADYNPQSITRGLMGSDHPITPIPEPQKLYDLGAYPTPFKVLFRRPANVLQG